MGAEEVTTYFDELGIPEWMAGPSGWGTYVADSRYSVYGEVLQLHVSSANFNQLNYSYEQGTRRLSQIRFTREGIAGDDLNTSYTYDNAGNVLSAFDTPHDAAQTDKQCFAYDSQARLVEAWTPKTGCSTAPSVANLGGPAPYWHSYSYDKMGNRTGYTTHATTGNTSTSYTRPPAGSAGAHQITTAVTTSASGAKTTNSYTYDAAGNTLTRALAGQSKQTLTWDVEGRLAGMTAGSTAYSYIYSADGDRLIRREGSSRTVYLPGGGELTRTGSTTSAVRYYTFNGDVVASRTAQGSAGVVSLVGNSQHTPQLAVNNATNAPVRRHHDPYGNPRDKSPVTWMGDHGFLDKPTDSSGLTHVGAR